MSKFNLGDRVTIIKNYDGVNIKGKTAEIIKLPWGHEQRVKIRIDDWLAGHGLEDNEWNILESHLEIYESLTHKERICRKITQMAARRKKLGYQW